MTLHAQFRSLDAVAAHLPFPVDAYDRVNEVFVRWVTNHHPKDHEVVQLWTYCYINRYYLTKALHYSRLTPTDVDDLIARAFTRVRDYLETVRAPDRYASWVSVLCHHLFLNYARSHRTHVDLDKAPPLAEEPDEATQYDRLVLRQLLQRAILALPIFLQEVGRRRFLEAQSYEIIEQETGIARASVRAYVGKIARRFREDPGLRAYFDHVEP